VHVLRRKLEVRRLQDLLCSSFCRVLLRMPMRPPYQQRNNCSVDCELYGLHHVVGQPRNQATGTKSRIDNSRLRCLNRYQWSFPCSFLSTIGELKEATAADEPWCGYCNALCGIETKDAADTADTAHSEVPMERAPDDMAVGSATEAT